MIFSQEQIDELLDIVDYHSSFLVMSVLGKDSLTSYDRYVLEQNGIDVDKIILENPSYYQMYMFGRLSAELSNAQGGQVDYDNFKKYIKRGQYVPLSSQEKQRYDIAKKKSYNHLKGLGEKQKTVITSIISEEMIKGVEDRKTIKSIVGEIGNRTQDWQRDYGRIVDTEMNNIFQQGRAESIKAKSGDKSLVFKDVYSGACKWCIKLYLTNGIGSKPILFELSELEANGSNYGKKVADWKATLDGVHPQCRCTLRSLPKGFEWNEEEGKFTQPKEYKTERKTKAILRVGDKEFLV